MSRLGCSSVESPITKAQGRESTKGTVNDERRKFEPAHQQKEAIRRRQISDQSRRLRSSSTHE